MPTITHAQLATQSLKPVYVLASDDNLLRQEARDNLRKRALQAGFNEREVFHLDQPNQVAALFASLDHLSLFSSKSVIEAYHASGKFDDAMLKALMRYLERPSTDKLLIFLTDKLTQAQQKTRWYKAIESAGDCVLLRSPSANELPNWIMTRAKSLGLNLAPGSVNMLAELTQGNLLATHQALQKLLLLAPAGTITPTHIMAATSDQARFDVFDLSNAVLAGQAAAACRALHVLRDTGTEATLVLWALTRELRELGELLFQQQQGVPIATALQKQWQQRRPLLKAALTRLNLPRIQHLLQQAEQIDLSIKGVGYANSWDLLEHLTLQMALPHEKSSTHRAARRHV